ncbi:MAG: hypothetical protein FE835_14640 [Gammaproteobacteria bacterium]|nr:hypothetical protein [Gammaproteobacteria bacterium]
MTEITQNDLFGGVTVCTITKDPITSGLEQMEDKAYKRFCEKHYALISKLDDIGLPEPGQQIRLVTRRTFNSIQFIEYIAEREKILDMKIAIYSINFNAAKILLGLVNSGKINTVEILMSNLRNKAHREKEEIIKKMFTDHPRISLFFCSSHAKAFSCSTEAGNFYTLEGSGNMAYNSRVEQYVIDNDEQMYKFTCEWMSRIKEFLQETKELEVCDCAT